MNIQINPLSMVNRSGMQYIELHAETESTVHLKLTVLDAATKIILCSADVAFSAGKSDSFVMLPAAREDKQVCWEFTDENSDVVFSANFLWKRPREWTFYIMISSHTDIGLHNPPYIQRYNSAEMIDAAMRLCVETEDRNKDDRFRYVLEGSWVFDCHAGEHGPNCSRHLINDYVKRGIIGICTGLAGNHTQTFGLEEMARAACERQRLKDEWGIDCRTFSMIDMNGMSWGMVQPFTDAGYENVIFSPNHWNPNLSSVWPMDHTLPGAELNTEAGGGGSRMDMRWDSSLPRVFYWQSAYGGKPLLVWSGGMYSQGGVIFGFGCNTYPDKYAIRRMEACFARQLPRMEAKVPYDLWLLPCYDDDGEPNLRLTDLIRLWNENWRWPRLRTLGDPDEPFTLLRQRFGGMIPTVSGDITGGWYQHPISAPDFLARKMEADRLLPAAEKLCTMAALTNAGFLYPAEDFDRAWKALLCNDEHSYGTSGYQGRRVYETWMQHRDWIETALETARAQSNSAMKALSASIAADRPSVIAFNTTAWEMQTDIEYGNRIYRDADLPPMGYRVLALDDFEPNDKKTSYSTYPPVLENEFYCIHFHENGSIRSIVDKEIGRELLSAESSFSANCFIWTQDNHVSYSVPGRAHFEFITFPSGAEVVSYMEENDSGAAIVQHVSLLNGKKLILIDNELNHVAGLYNSDRYKRYAYYAFPLDVPAARRICALNGCEAEYAKDTTGHGTDVYMAAHEWICAENSDFGVGVIQWDSELVEFDHIHPDKTDYGLPGNGSALFFCLANDWLQMHSPGGSHMNYRFRYAIMSYRGNHTEAKLAATAEKLLNPPLTAYIDKQSGLSDSKFMSFLSSDCRVLTLKPAMNHSGIVMRVYGNKPSIPKWNPNLFGTPQTRWCTVDEQSTGQAPVGGFGTLLSISDRLKIKTAVDDESVSDAAGSLTGIPYTGLIRRPCAARGEEDGMLYLLWGASRSKDLAGYELFRGTEEAFEADDKSLIAFVEPEEYCVGRYVDKGLDHHTRYFYRLRTVYKKGKRGPLSEVFDAWTKE